MEGSRRPKFADRWARTALSCVLAVAALGMAAPAASPDPGGKSRGNGAPGGAHVAPGQAKKAAEAALADAQARTAALAGALRADAGAAPAGAPPAAARGRAKRTPRTGSEGAPAASRAPASRSSAPATSSSRSSAARASNPSGARASTASARAATAPPAQAAQAPPPPPAAVVAPLPVAAPPPVAAVTPPAASASPETSSSPRRRPGSTTRPAGSISPRAPAAALVPVVAPERASGPAAPVAGTSGDRRGDSERTGAARDEAPGSPITRTVVRVLEVIPPGVQMALAGLALLGLLLGAAALVQTVRGRRLARQRRMLLDDVGILQSALLPELPRRIGGARVTAAYRPAAGLAAGGDFYDAFELPGGRTAVIVGDVAGHGRDAVPLTALARYNLRAYLEAGLAPRATLDVASHVLAPQLAGRQVTIVVAIFDPGTGRLTYACAGHAPPLLPDSDVTPVTVSSSPPIGAGVPTGRRQTTVGLAPGRLACFHTDGLGEVPVRSGERLGREGVARELEALGPRASAAELIDRIVSNSEGQPDDMAACILSAGPGGAATWTLRIEELEVDPAMLRSGGAERFLVACGVGGAHISRALREARQMVGLAGSAVVEVRIGEELVEVRIDPPPAVMLPIARRPTGSFELAETG